MSDLVNCIIPNHTFNCKGYFIIYKKGEANKYKSDLVKIEMPIQTNELSGTTHTEISSNFMMKLKYIMSNEINAIGKDNIKNSYCVITSIENTSE